MQELQTIMINELHNMCSKPLLPPGAPTRYWTVLMSQGTWDGMSQGTWEGMEEGYMGGHEPGYMGGHEPGYMGGHGGGVHGRA